MTSPSTPAGRRPDDTSTALAGRHLRLGWWGLFAFAAAGLVLELLHGFKVAAYLDVNHETRRLLWRLAHAHGALIALVHIAFGLSVRTAPATGGAHATLASRLLVGALILLPGGFFLGGVTFYTGDPGLGILLVPVGACCLLGAVALVARAPGA